MTRLTYNQLIQGFPSYRVFVYGVEVTTDVTNVAVQWAVGRAPSQATISLLSPLDKYVMTTADIMLLNPKNVAAFAKQAPNSDLARLYKYAVTDKNIIRGSVNDPTSVKALVTKIKTNPVFLVSTSPTDPFTGEQFGPIKIPIYPFIDGKSVFHQNDAMRIFVQDPFDMQVWYFLFAGKITRIMDTVLGANLEKTLDIQCEDVSKSLRYARYTTNPGIRNPVVVTNQDLASFTGFTSPLAGLTLAEAADAIVFGDLGEPKAQLNSEAKVSVPAYNRRTGRTFNQIMPKTAAGNFKWSPIKQRVYTIGHDPNYTSITLPQWQNDILRHTVSVNDIAALYGNSDHPEPPDEIVTALKQKAAEAQATNSFDATLTQLIITEIGTNPDLYPVDGGTLYMLLPTGISELGKDVIAREFVSTISMVSEFKDRRSLMYDLVDRVEFFFYADPKGNLVIEFPMYDFDPDQFDAQNSTAGQIVAANDKTVSSPVRFTTTDPGSGSVLFNNQARFTIEDEVVEQSVATDDDTPVRTVCVTVPVVSRAYQKLQGGNIQTSPRQVQVVKLDALFPIYGPRVLQGDARRIVETDRAALISGAIELNKANADAYSYKVPILPRFSAWLNRPMLYRYRNHIGLTMSISHQISWAGDISTTLNFAYARGWAGEMDSGKLVYSTIGGKHARSINYAALFAQSRTHNDNPPQTSDGSGSRT